MENNQVRLGIALIPNHAMVESIVELQQHIISLYPLSPKLGTDHNLPHITLLQGQFQHKVNWQNLLSDLRNFCIQQNHALALKLSGWKYEPEGWYFLTLQDNPLFFEAHQFVFERLEHSMIVPENDSPALGNAAPTERLRQHQKNIAHYTPLEKFNYLNYGYRFIGESFRPHITIGRTLNRTPLPNLPHSQFSILNSQLSGAIARFTLYQQGEDGSHAKTLFSLKI